MEHEVKSRSPSHLTPLIVGFGRAGRDLHSKCLRRIIGPQRTIHVVDPAVTRIDDVAVYRHPDIAGAVSAAGATEDIVAHICTPPRHHCRAVAEALDAGVRQFIIEKPLADTVEDAWRIGRMIAQSNARSLPVSVLSGSVLTQEIAARIEGGAIGQVVSMDIHLLKPRFSRAQDGSHTTALEVEIPHGITLAHVILGDPVVPIRCEVADLRLPDGQVVASMGGAVLELEFGGGVECRIISDLMSPIRQRSIGIEGTRGGLRGDFPVSGMDNVSQLHIADDRFLFYDEPLGEFIRSAYSYFAGSLPWTKVDMDSQIRQTEIIAACKSLSGWYPQVDQESGEVAAR